MDLVDLVDRKNVWMVQSGRGFGFLDEAANAIAGGVSLLFEDVRGKNFECDFAVETGVVGKINLAHAAGAKLGADFVASDFCIRGERQSEIQGS